MKKTLALILALAMALALVACGGNSAPAATEAPKAEAPAAEAPAADNTGAGKTVGIAMPTQSSERWIKDGANMKSQLEAKGYNFCSTAKTTFRLRFLRLRT